MIGDKTIKKLSKEFPGHKFELIESDGTYTIKMDGEELKCSFAADSAKELKETHDINIEDASYDSILIEACHILGKPKKKS